MKALHFPLDRISTLPQTIIEALLCLLPIQDAVRTSILSKNWRNNWVNIPKLEFDEDQLLKVSTNTNQLSKCNLFYTIYQVLLQHHGPLLEFILTISTLESCPEIDLIIRHLLRNNTVKKLTFGMSCSTGYRLPSSFFSLNHLTHLNLQHCELWLPSTFIGFGNLTSLHLEEVYTNSKMILRFISNCPLLKSFTLIEFDIYFEDLGDSTIAELFESLPAIEHLCMNYFAIECFAKGMVLQELPILLAHLRCFDLLESDMNKYELSFAFLLIKSSPKLEKIRIQIVSEARFPPINYFIELHDYSDVWLDHLAELEVVNFRCLKRELEFVQLMLVKSPVLKKVCIDLSYTVSDDEELRMLRTLLRLPRVSPGVEIIVKRPALAS